MYTHHVRRIGLFGGSLKLRKLQGDEVVQLRGREQRRRENQRDRFARSLFNGVRMRVDLTIVFAI